MMVVFMSLLGCLSAHPPDLYFVVQEFERFHPTVYSIYGSEPQEDTLHRILAAVFVGQKLTQEYVEHFTTLHHMSIEETSIDVKQVDYNHIEVLNFDFGWVQLDVDWSVGGVVTHQGHKHTRVNRYHAVYTLIEIAPDQWRVSNVKMRNAERIRRATDEDILNGEDAGGGYLDPMDLLEAGMFDLPEENDEAEVQIEANKVEANTRGDGDE